MGIGKESNSREVELISLAIEEAKIEILKELKGKDPWWWKITLIILPIILASALGLMGWRFQSKIQSNIDNEAYRLTVRMNLSQDLYKQRLKTYMDLYNSILDIESFFKNSGTTHADDKPFIPLSEYLAKLTSLFNSNKLFISEQLYMDLNEMWFDIVSSFNMEEIPQDQVMSIVDDKEKTVVELKEKIEAQMRKDLLMNYISPEAIIENKDAAREGQNEQR